MPAKLMNLHSGSLIVPVSFNFSLPFLPLVVRESSLVGDTLALPVGAECRRALAMAGVKRVVFLSIDKPISMGIILIN